MTIQRNDDSAMTNLRELMLLEEERVENERLARVQAEAERARRAAEERARAQAEALEKARAAEQARIDAERGRRELEAKIEAERSDRELRIRLEVESQRRAAEHEAMLAHQARLAQFATPPRRGVSTGAALGLIGLTLGGIIAVAAVFQSQIARPVPTPAVAAPAPSSSAGDGLAELRRQRDEAIARANAAVAAANAARDHVVQPAVNHPVRPRNDGHPNVAPRPNTQDNTLRDLDSDGDSMITRDGIEGARSSSQRRPRH